MRLYRFRVKNGNGSEITIEASSLHEAEIELKRFVNDVCTTMAMYKVVDLYDVPMSKPVLPRIPERY